jgi:hypothetical protein
MDKKNFIITCSVLIFFGYSFFILFKGFPNSKYEKRNIDLPKSAKRNVFFDLGANEGDSIANFFGLIPRANGGSFKGQIPQDKINEKWTVYAIEGNWAFTNKLLAMKSTIEKMGHEVIVMNGTVGWIYDGFLTFYIDKTDINKPNSVIQLGSSPKENHV